MMRPLLAVVALLSLTPLGTAADERDEVAVKALEKLGGRFERDKTGAVIKLRLWCREVDSKDLKHIASLTSLRELDLSSTKVGDAGLKHISSLKQLTCLRLQSS